jgi:hypothetical protein
MAYGSFRRIEKVIQTFAIEVREGALFPTDLQPIEPSSWLKTTLEKAKRVGFVNEKERSERVVYPVLLEVAEEINHNQITIYSGRNLDVDASNGLNGECDFLLALGKKPLVFLDAPIFTVVEAKKEDIEYGIAQCAAQMIGTQKFNAQKGKSVPFIYGLTTDAGEWVFMKLEKNILTIDKNTLYLQEIELILAAFQYAIEDCKK